jgi:hypothetical protein
MSLSDLAKQYEPKENQEFGGRKKLVGDGVGTGTLDRIRGKKDGKEWLLLKIEVINTVEDPKGRPTSLMVGDEVPFFFDPADDISLKKLMDDLFTSGISFDREGDDEMIVTSIVDNVKDKLFYVRTWAKEKTPEQLEKYGDDPSYFQNQKILTSNKITEEMKVPVMPI